MSDTYIIKREFGRHSDYLHAWDWRWGTTCGADPGLALTFGSRRAAEHAAVRAAMYCIDYHWNRNPSIKFSVAATPEPHPHYLADDESDAIYQELIA